MSTTNSTCLHVVAGNTFEVAVQLTQIAWGDGTGTTTDFVPEDDDTIRASLICRGRVYRCLDLTVDDSTLTFTVKGNIAIGMYDLEILILRSDGTKLRSLQEDAIEIVYSNSDAGIPDTDELQQTSFTINSAVFMLVSGVELEWDDEPTEDSGAVVTSGGIYTALAEMSATMIQYYEDLTDDIEDLNDELSEKYAITSMEQTTTSTESEGVNIVTTTFDNGETATFEVRNGAQGEQGVQGDTVILGDENTYTLYNITGENTDGAMTQAATTEAINDIFADVVSADDVAAMDDPE